MSHQYLIPLAWALLEAVDAFQGPKHFSVGASIQEIGKDAVRDFEVDFLVEVTIWKRNDRVHLLKNPKGSPQG